MLLLLLPSIQSVARAKSNARQLSPRARASADCLAAGGGRSGEIIMLLQSQQEELLLLFVEWPAASWRSANRVQLPCCRQTRRWHHNHWRRDSKRAARPVGDRFSWTYACERTCASSHAFYINIELRHRRRRRRLHGNCCSGCVVHWPAAASRVPALWARVRRTLSARARARDALVIELLVER